MGVTSVYGLRYLDLDDPPDLPKLGKDLAEDVEGVLSGGSAALAVGAVAAGGNVTVAGTLTATGRISGAPIGAQATRATNFPITTGGIGVVVEFTTQVYDYGNLWSGAAPGSFIVPIAGRYDVDVFINFVSAVGGVRDVHILLNGTSQRELRLPAIGGVSGQPLSVSGVVQAQAGDTISARALQNSGASLNITAARMNVDLRGA